MFKRPHVTKLSNSISNSARKKLVQEAISSFFPAKASDSSPACAVVEPLTVVNQLIPTGLKFAKAYTHLQEQVAIYTDLDAEPIWIKADKGNGALIPTVYTLLKYPALLPTVRTNRMVLEKLTGGADLMVPGLLPEDLENLKPFKKHTLVAVVDAQSDTNDKIWAVGYLAEDGEKLVGSGSGKAVVTLSARNDFLWLAGSQRVPAPLEIAPASDPVNGSCSAEAVNGQAADVPTPTTPVSGENTNGGSTAPVVAKLPPDEVDQILLSSLLLCLYLYDPHEPNLPLPASLFYSDCILPLRPFECQKSVGVKDSSAKNLTRWLKAMQKKNYLTVKEDRKGGEMMVMSLNPEHEDVRKVVEYRTLADEEKSSLKLQPTDKANISLNPNQPRSAPTTLTELFKAKAASPQSRWLESTKLNPKALHTQSAIRGALVGYLDQFQCNNAKDRRLVEPDPLLAEAMSIDQVRPMTRAAALDILLPQFEPWWKLERDGQVLAESKGKMPSLRLKKKKRAGPKHATLITGLEVFGIDPIQFAKHLRTLCAGSTTTHPAPQDNSLCKLPKEVLMGKMSAVEVECQGDRRSFLEKYLVEQCGVCKKYIEVV